MEPYQNQWQQCRYFEKSLFVAFLHPEPSFVYIELGFSCIFETLLASDLACNLDMTESLGYTVSCHR